MNLNANWNYPTPIRIGAGRVAEIPSICSDMAISNPLIVTDPGIAEFPMITDLMKLCQKENLEIALFSNIKPNPTGKNVEDGTHVFRQGNHDGVIAFGGGSALDAAKAIALMVGQNRPIWDFEDVGDNWQRVNVEGMAPVIAVPTTAGTGSEVGRASVIVDEDTHVKRIIFHANMLPAQVILDPELTIGLPAFLTAATGMDALSHNLEAYCANFYHPMAEGIAQEGIRLIKAYLAQAVKDGSNLEARTQMIVASSMGATAFQRGLGGMHAIVHPLGALYDAHHGLLNAVLMPYVLVANRSVIENRIARLANNIGLSASFDAFINWVLELRQSIAIPHSLSEAKLTQIDFVKVGEMAEQDPSAGGNPRPFKAEQYQLICEAAHAGNLEMAMIP